ncbi:MAG: caspase family protein [Salinivirgaceae bacterium]|nr:caspase family protein [Salinivirgaceae bacterium]
MKKLIFIIAVSIIATGGMAQNPKKSYKAGKKLFEVNDFQGALNELNQAIILDQNYVDAIVLRGQAYEKLENLDLAASDYEKALCLDKKTVDYLYQAGRLNYLIQNYEKALQYLSEAVILDNGNFQAFQFKSFTHIKLKDYKNAIVAIDNALKIEKTYVSYYTRGVANDSLKVYPIAIADYSKAIGLSPNFKKAYYSLTRAYLKNNQLDDAFETANRAVQKFANDADAYDARSLVYHHRGELANAINDLSKLETLVDDATLVLLTRGIYYFEFGQFQNAKSDFNQLIAKDNNNIEAIYWRGRANEELIETKLAVVDYQAFEKLAKDKQLNTSKLADVNKRLFELLREEVAPLIVMDSAIVIGENKLAVLNDADRITIKGKIEDKSSIVNFTINGEKIEINSDYTFSQSINITGISTVSVAVSDIYNNTTEQEFDLQKMETNAPLARITTPYASDNGEIYLDSDDTNLFIEGFVEDESNIKDIYIDDVRASFNDADLNPKFAATVNIMNKNKITVIAVDAFNNKLETSFTLNREGAQIAEDNPMGKTWVIFIENSSYETFASLDGPTKDVATMKSALANYQVHNFIHKKDMSKKEMERFFSIELRDQVKKNNVNSLLVWYAGHGKFINETGYWIPIDATRDDEFTYFNINSLKAGMQSYSNFITHTLVVTDACESGPSFYQAMRATNKVRSCDDASATKFKSSQVFSSAGYELASDNSQFTKTFAKSLQFNNNVCMPIESIVVKVTEAVSANENQKPQFGKIAGFEDENGTFFFIRK